MQELIIRHPHPPQITTRNPWPRGVCLGHFCTWRDSLQSLVKGVNGVLLGLCMFTAAV